MGEYRRGGHVRARSTGRWASWKSQLGKREHAAEDDSGGQRVSTRFSSLFHDLFMIGRLGYR